MIVKEKIIKNNHGVVFYKTPVLQFLLKTLANICEEVNVLVKLQDEGM